MMIDRVLFNLYNELKYQYYKAITDRLEPKTEFSPYIRISFDRDSDDLFEDIVSIEYNDDDKRYYIHSFITSTDLSVEEMYIPLVDMSFDTLFKIAERI